MRRSLFVAIVLIACGGPEPPRPAPKVAAVPADAGDAGPAAAAADPCESLPAAVEIDAGSTYASMLEAGRALVRSTDREASPGGDLVTQEQRTKWATTCLNTWFEWRRAALVLADERFNAAMRLGSPAERAAPLIASAEAWLGFFEAFVRAADRIGIAEQTRAALVVLRPFVDDRVSACRKSGTPKERSTCDGIDRRTRALFAK